MPSFRYLTPAQIETLEDEYMQSEGIDTRELVRRVGSALSSELYFFQYDMYRGPSAAAKKVSVVCGWGLNGADGWETAVHLQRQYGIRTTVITLVSPDELEGVAYEVAQDAIAEGLSWIEVPLHDRTDMLRDLLVEADIVVDAIFGRNFSAPLGPDFAHVCQTINASMKMVVSIDVPSGVSVKNAEVDRSAVNAGFTFSLFAVHKAFLQEGPFLSTIMFKVEDFGSRELQDRLFADAPKMYTDDALRPALPFPAFDANKYTRGRVLIVAGSKQYTGAAVLATKAATLCGPGYVTLACPESLVPIMQHHLVTAPVVGLPETDSGGLGIEAFERLESLSEAADAVLIGPGLGRHTETLALVRRLVAELVTPLVLDADALFAFKGNPEALSHSRALITITPHEGELASLIDSTSTAVVADPISSAKKLSYENTVVLLKGHNSYLIGRDECSADLFSPPMLATAGTGDVLAGMVTAFIAQRVPAYMSSLLGVRIQGIAAKSSLRKVGPISVTALSVLEAIPEAIGVLMSGRWPSKNE